MTATQGRHARPVEAAQAEAWATAAPGRTTRKARRFGRARTLSRGSFTTRTPRRGSPAEAPGLAVRTSLPPLRTLGACRSPGLGLGEPVRSGPVRPALQSAADTPLGAITPFAKRNPPSWEAKTPFAKRLPPFPDAKMPFAKPSPGSKGAKAPFAERSRAPAASPTPFANAHPRPARHPRPLQTPAPPLRGRRALHCRTPAKRVDEKNGRVTQPARGLTEKRAKRPPTPTSRAARNPQPSRKTSLP